jgi:limonene-1,2-epoxide hydrolase
LQLTEAVDWITHRQIEVGEAVANERTDRFLIKGNWVEGRVAGFFEVHDGQITLWRDYFDLAMLVNAFSA